MAFMNEISENFQKKTDMLVRKEVIIKLVLFSFLFLIVLVFLGESRRKYILSESRHAFSAAILEEKNLFISKVSFQYKAEYSPNNISAEEKKNWGDQYYLIQKDSCRYRLDSLFRQELMGRGLELQTAVSRTFNGKTIASCQPDFFEKATLLHEYTYRKDENNQSDIILRAYIYLPFYLLFDYKYFYILILVYVLGVFIYLYYKQMSGKKDANCVLQPQVSIPSSAIENDEVIQERNIVQTEWITVTGDYLWDAKNHILKSGEKKIILKGESLRYFQQFVVAEHFFLNYGDLHALYKNRGIEESKDCIYHTILQLRKELKIVDVKVESIRGVGYRLLFD